MTAAATRTGPSSTRGRRLTAFHVERPLRRRHHRPRRRTGFGLRDTGRRRQRFRFSTDFGRRRSVAFRMRSSEVRRGGCVGGLVQEEVRQYAVGRHVVHGFRRGGRQRRRLERPVAVVDARRRNGHGVEEPVVDDVVELDAAVDDDRVVVDRRRGAELGVERRQRAAQQVDRVDVGARHPAVLGVSAEEDVVVAATRGVVGAVAAGQAAAGRVDKSAAAAAAAAAAAGS